MTPVVALRGCFAVVIVWSCAATVGSLRVPALSAGLYVLPAGGADLQQPHTEDELYYVVSGRGAIQVAGESRAVEAGSVVFVKAGDDHRFHSIAEELVILVFFAPAEYTNKRVMRTED